jgi:hypothetical protein
LNYALEFKHNSLSKIAHKEMDIYYETERGIALLQNQIYKIRNNPHYTPEQKINRENEIWGNIHNLKTIKEQLITSSPTHETSHFLEQGINPKWSYGIKFTRVKTNLRNVKSITSNNFAIFAKRKLLEKKNYIFTISPSIGISDGIKSARLGLSLGHSKKTKKKFFGKKIRFFQYVSVEAKTDIDKSNNKKPIYESEIAIGMKIGDRMIFMLQDFEVLNKNALPRHQRIHNNKLTLAYDISTSRSESHNKIYLNCGYFVVNSVKARRVLSSGYSLGVWAEL